MGLFLWILSAAISAFILYWIVKSAINGSVMADLYHENRLLVEAHNRNAKALADLAEEVKQIRHLMERSDPGK